MDEDRRNTFGILMGSSSPHSKRYYLCPGGRARGVASKGPKSILYKHSHIAYQIEGIE